MLHTYYTNYTNGEHQFPALLLLTQNLAVVTAYIKPDTSTLTIQAIIYRIQRPLNLGSWWL
jgi:hypothetical protein